MLFRKKINNSKNHSLKQDMTKMPLSLQVIARHSSNSEEIIQSNYLDESNEMLVSEHKKLFGTMKTTKSKDKVKTK